MFFDFIDEVMAKFVFWKPLKTLGIFLEASDPHVARTSNLQKTVCFSYISNIPPCHTVTKLTLTLGKRTDVASSVNYLGDRGVSGGAG